MDFPEDLCGLGSDQALPTVPPPRYGLVIHPGALGDLILTLPLIRFLRLTLNLDRVDVMGRAERLAVLDGRSDAGQVLCLESANLHRLFQPHDQFDLSRDDPLVQRFVPYEVIITFLGEAGGDFERNLAYTASITHCAEIVSLPVRPPEGSPLHAAEFYIRQVSDHYHLGWLDTEALFSTPLMRPAPEDSQVGNRLISGQAPQLAGKPIVIHPGSGGSHKCWPMENFCEIAARLGERGAAVLFLLGPAETERWERSVIEQLTPLGAVVCGLDLPEVAALLSSCLAYLGNDSGISHLAAALDVPTAVVFGPSTPRQWRPLGRNVKVVAVGESDAVGQASWPAVGDVLKALGSG